MANISAIKKQAYTITQADIDSAGAQVLILWDSPFYDTNYAVSLSVESANFPTFLYPNQIALLTPAGFTACFTLGAPGFTAGDQIIVHAMASHK